MKEKVRVKALKETRQGRKKGKNMGKEKERNGE
jgi:hypothetical protein